jgi:hypothetical protein
VPHRAGLRESKTTQSLNNARVNNVSPERMGSIKLGRGVFDQGANTSNRVQVLRRGASSRGSCVGHSTCLEVQACATSRGSA